MGYSDGVKGKAWELRQENGLTHPEIADELKREFGERPTEKTIQRWLKKGRASRDEIKPKLPAVRGAALSEKPALLSLCARAYESRSTGEFLRPYRQTPLLWVDVEVTNASHSPLLDVEVWVTDVAREDEWVKDRGEPWSAIPLAWRTGKYKIAIPAERARTARLLYCDDENGLMVVLGRLRLFFGALRVELEVSSPYSATVKKVFFVRVTPRSHDQKELELNGKEAPAVKDAWRCCKEIINDPARPWLGVIDLEKIPHRIVSPRAGSKAQTPWDKVAERVIAANRVLEGLRAPIDMRVKRLEGLRSEVGEDVWATLLTYFPIHERPAHIEVE